jgi:hypothetical protein
MWAMRDKPGEAERAEREALMDRFAAAVVERRMAAPAILFLESVKPVSFLGNQALVFFQPIVQSLFEVRSYDKIVAILEDRQNLEYILKKIEELDAEQQTKAREERKRRKDAKRAARTSEEGHDGEA